MRVNYLSATLKTAVLAATVLLLGVGLAVAQQTINLTAAPTTVTVPDGSTVPMWGYSCGTAAAGSTATCAALNPNAATGWSPVVVTVPYLSRGTSLTINLTNGLSFTPTGTTTPNTVPTSLIIVGQVGGGLGSLGQRTTTASPDHSQAQSNVTWPIAANPAPTPGTPPVQGPRVQSFATEVATGVTTALTWSSLKPGTYLLESGTHPSIQVPMGLYGILVVTAAPAGTTVGTAYPAVRSTPAVTYNAEIPLEFSEIDPVQNNSVNVAVNTIGFSETMVWSGQPGGCGNPSSSTYHQCYPPAVNYIPLYYLINGVAFNKTNATSSMFSVTPATSVTGNVLVRLVNAGSRMHVPSIVGSMTTQTVGGASSVLSGFSITAEDGNVLPGVPKVQSDLFMAAGKTNDVLINVPTSATAPALAVFDRELSLSGNATERDAGMLAYISVNGAGLPTSPSLAGAVARADSYSSMVPCAAAPCAPVIVSDPGKGVIANDTNVYGVQLLTSPVGGTVTLHTNGTFTYVPNVGSSSDAFTYCANGSVTGTTCSSGLTATVTLGAAAMESASGITCTSPTSYTANSASYLAIKTPGVLSSCKDAAGYPLTAAAFTGSGLTVTGDANGGFNASLATPCTTIGGCPGSFTFQAKNSQGTLSSAMTVNITFPVGSGLIVTVLDGSDKSTVISDYRWIIEEDKSFYVNPNCTTNATTPPAGCPAAVSGGAVPAFGVNFHPSHMEYVAQGCTGPQSCESGQTLLGQPAVCDVGNGVCRTTGTQETAVDPSQVPLDPTKRYYISVLPGDAANPFGAGFTGTPDCSAAGRTAGHCGHGMGGAPIIASCFPTASCTSTSNFPPVTALTQPSPYPPAKLSVQVFEDDFPLNGEQDAGGGVDILATNEPGLGGFNIELVDQKGTFGDVTGHMTYDMFNQPLSNSLAGTIDPATGMDACPISVQVTSNATTGDGTQQGITGQIVTCPKYESDGVTLSPLSGEAVIANLMPGFYSVIAMPGADRIARGEEWLQTNTLDGQKAHDAFVKIGEPAYFQEYGPAGFHVSVGFANPAIINSRLSGVCDGTDLNVTASGPCTNSVTGKITSERMSRTPDQRLYSSGSRDAYSWTQCYVSMGDPDGEDFAFTKCAADGTFSLNGLPPGIWRLTVFDQWNDQIVDGLSTPVQLAGGKTVAMGDIPQQQWQSDLNTRTFIDDNKDGVYQSNELGIPLASVSVRYRDGELANNLLTDFGGVANFNETFPLFNWYTVETDPTRYKTTGIHTVYDAGGPADGTICGTPWPNCGSSVIAKNLANTYDPFPLPANLSVPGAVYCNDADCTGAASIFSTGATVPSSTSNHSTGRIDAPWVWSEGWQGFIGQFNFIEFGKTPYAVGENGGITGHVIYASTRPFDDPMMLVQTQWEPLVPRVTMNLYQEGFAVDGVTPTLNLVDTAKTSSWDDWAQGFRSDGIPYMNCPGQSTADLFYFTLYNQSDYLDVYNSQHGGASAHTLPYNSQYKCYDGMHNWNQIQPAPYDGAYAFPSITGFDSVTGKPTGTNCTICTTDPDSTDQFRFGTPMLPPGKYVVEVVLPPGFELVKEEDKNILIGDNFIAPVTQEFGGLGDIFILPDQASLGAAYNANNAQNPTQSLGAVPRTSTVPSYPFEPVWPCVGEMRIVPDYMSIFPQAKEVAAFAGASRPLCDRKEVTLGDQTGAIAKFYIFTSTHIGSKFTGIITDDFTSEFDPFAPTFGEKFSPPNMPVSFRDWAGNEVSRVYSDQWGVFNGMTYSTWEVNPPNPTGYAPGMMINCMNDAGPIPDPNNPGHTITDPLFNPLYSQFCYEDPYMPGVTDYLDTPVVPTAGFVGAGYNNPDCAYPTLTPAVSSVTGDVAGPWVSAAGHTLTINALGDQQVNNYGYSGPSAQTAPFNQKKVSRHYGFGNTTGTVAIGGKAATVGTWSDTAITVTVPTGVPQCAVQQQEQYGAPGQPARCGELVITAATGQQSIDAVTITIGGKAPTVLAAGQTIQSAIDTASPGDMIIVPPGTYRELVIMWKPVRLQGVGAASSIIDATTHPAGTLKLDAWRRRVNCLFGLALNGQPSTGNGPKGGTNTNPYDPSGAYSCPGSATGDTWNYFSGGPNYPTMVVDRIPLEGILGWDATVNGNLAEQLQEPSIMGSYEGAAITVVAKGVNIPAGSTDVFGSGAEATFPTGSTLLTNADCATGPGGSNLYPSNFQCNPSSIDAMGITDASQGGGAIFLHAWTHNLQIANNRVYNNSGTLSGGMVIGQGEFPEAYLAPTGFGPGATSAPGSCQNSSITNTQLPYCLQLNVNMHHNMVTYNSSTGDELFTGTPAGAGGVSICTGSDYYQFNYNWVCGNMSSGDGGGVGQLGFSYNGDIEHNTIIFNQSTNPTIPANGGGLLIMGAAPDGTTLVNGVAVECGSVTDNDCVPGLSDGIGPGLVINANLLMGNAAEAGSGGGLRFQAVNGADVARFPADPERWYSVQVTNNVIANNVAGWDGGGVSLEDALVVNLINNTIASNDTTASSGTLFNTLGAPLASGQSPPSTITTNGTSTLPQPAGVVTMVNSPQLTSSFTTGAITCPSGHYQGTSAINGTCTKVSYPMLQNNVLWQNRSFNIGVGALSPQYQQNVVSLFTAFTENPAPNQTSTGACPNGVSYWDIGVRGDTGPSNHASGFTLAPRYSVLTDSTDYPGLNNLGSNPALVSQYCNGSRVPPENGGLGYQVPPGISDATAPNPLFSLTPNATVDEGNNWVNISWGPLSMSNPSTNAALGNYTMQSSSPAIDYVPVGQAHPHTDFLGNPRPDPSNPTRFDVGAFEFQGAVAAPTLTSISTTSGLRGTSVNVTLTGTNLSGTQSVNVSGAGVTVSNLADVNQTTVTATFTISNTAALTARNVTITTSGGTTGSVTFTVTGPTLASINPTSGQRATSVPVTLSGTALTGATAVNVSGGGITVSGLTVVNDSTVTATFTIGTGAALTGRTVSVTTPIGTTSTVQFTVTSASVPTLTSISPTSGARGTTVPITLTGTNLNGAAAVSVSGGGFTCTISGTPTATTVNASCMITAGAGLTTRNVSVTTPVGTATLPGSFTVTGPTVAAITPTSGTHNTSLGVAITGSDLTGATSVTAGSGITASNIVVNAAGTELTATFTITNGAAHTARNVRVVTPNGTTPVNAAVTFGVN